jgi:hypothetical protein
MTTTLTDLNYQPSPFFQTFEIKLDMIYFDKLLCCLLENNANQKYIAHFLTYEDDIELWLLIPTEEGHLKRLLSGCFPLRQSFDAAPESFRIVAQVDQRSESVLSVQSVAVLADLALANDFLPNHEYIFFKDEFSEYLEEELEPTLQSARSNFSEIIDFTLTDRTLSEMPIDQLANICLNAQRLITNLASHKSNPDAELGKRGTTSINNELRSKMALTFLKTGSVKLRFETIQQPDPLTPELDPAYQGSKAFAELLNISKPQDICNKLAEYPPRIRKNFLQFITATQKARTGIKTGWASGVTKEESLSSWDTSIIEEISERVTLSTVSNETEIETNGYFIQANLGTNHYTFIDTDSGRQITGKYDTKNTNETPPETITLTKENKTFGALYSVVIKETYETKEDGSTTYNYTFLHVEKVTTPSQLT